jgi:hypothetical protein
MSWPRCETSRSNFELKDLARTIDGYSPTFQMGMVTHVESDIDDALVEESPRRRPSMR